MKVEPTVHQETNIAMYYLDHPHFFDVVENIVIITISPISTFVVVVVATSVTVVQLGRVIIWKQSQRQC